MHAVNWSIAAFIAGALVLVLLGRRVAARRGKLSRHSYQKHAAIFSPDQRAFYRTLKVAMGEEYEIFGKIRIAEIIRPKKTDSRGDKTGTFDFLSGQNFDFVLCDKASLAVVCAIQLRDKAHSSRQGGEDPIAPICENLSLPLVRFQIKAEYSVAEIREKLSQAMVKEPVFLVETSGRKEPSITNLEDLKF